MKIESAYIINGQVIRQTKVVSGNCGQGSADLHTLIYGLGEMQDPPMNRTYLTVLWPDASPGGYKMPIWAVIPCVDPGDSTAVYELTDPRQFSVDESSLSGSFLAGVEDNWWVFE